MGSWAQLRVGDIEIAQFKGEIEDWIALLFTADDWRARLASADELPYHGWDRATKVFELAAPIRIVRDRLELIGADWSSVEAAFDEALAVKADVCRQLIDDVGDVTDLESELDYLEGLTLNEWARRLTAAPPDELDATLPPVGSRAWLLDLWEDYDVRTYLRAVLACRDDDDLVVVDATDLIDGGWLDPSEDLRSRALLEFGATQLAASPIVVLTEGSTDAQILEIALDIVYPHLRGFIRFPDFAQRPEANAPALARTVKAFAAAGISNRVVALFDADTAARDAVRTLRPETLPTNIRILHLPPIDIARSYPTIGPSGSALDDINGRACSIELYLGHDVLTDGAGGLRPVRWGAFHHAVGDYHGVIQDKAAILNAFRTKARAAAADRRTPPSDNWSALRLILDKVRGAFPADGNP